MVQEAATKHSKNMRQVVFRVATFKLCPLSDTSIELQRLGFGRQDPVRGTVPRADRWDLCGAIQVLTHIQLPIDAMYVTK